MRKTAKWPQFKGNKALGWYYSNIENYCDHIQGLTIGVHMFIGLIQLNKLENTKNVKAKKEQRSLAIEKRRVHTSKAETEGERDMFAQSQTSSFKDNCSLFDKDLML